MKIATNRAVDLSYDRVYNRTSWSDTKYAPNGSLAYQSNAVNQYTAVGTRTPSYDGRGNLTCIGQYWTMTYDCENRMTSAISGYLQYGYDLLGRRDRRMLGSMNDIAYVWDGAHVIAEYTNGSLTKKYIYGSGMDNPVAMINVSGLLKEKHTLRRRYNKRNVRTKPAPCRPCKREFSFFRG